MRFRSPGNIGSFASITPAVRFLIILNVIVFILDVLSSSEPRYRFLTNLFGLQAEWWENYKFGQLFTYMFIHGSFWHILMNMMGLFFIGPAVERTIGSYRFFILYYLSGILGGLGWSLLASAPSFCVGASGAVMGILGAFAALYPNAKVVLLFFPFFPIKVWKVVLVFMLLEFYQTFYHPLFGGIANAAHLIGGLAGFSYAFALKHPHLVADLKSRIPGLSGGGRPAPRPSGRRTTGGDTLSKEEIDRILDKIGKQGMGALTPRERELLKRATR